MNSKLLKKIVEAALMAAGRPLSLGELRDLFPYRERPELAALREAIALLQDEFEDRGIELVEVATGYRIQVRPSMIDWLTKLWEERPPRYSRALLETLAMIAYRQPITRGDIEDVRGVAVSTNIVRTLLERGWVRVVGHREVPGKPELFATTPQFLDYFGLQKLDDLPPLAEISDIESVVPQLELSVEAENRTPLHVVIDSGEAAPEALPDESDDEADDENADGPAAVTAAGNDADDDDDADEEEEDGQSWVAAADDEDDDAGDEEEDGQSWVAAAEDDDNSPVAAAEDDDTSPLATASAEDVRAEDAAADPDTADRESEEDQTIADGMIRTVD